MFTTVNMADQPAELVAVAEAVREADEAYERRNTAIRAAHDAGHSMRAIARYAGLSPAAVHKILRRDQ